MPPRKRPPPRPEVVALLEECKGRPWDDGPRLVLADWLEEHGATAAERALAEFIRIGCRRWPEQARTNASPEKREEELFARHGAGWLGPLCDQGGWVPGHGLFNLRVLADTLADGALAEPALPEGWRWVEHAWVLGLQRRNAAAALSDPLVEQVGVVDLSESLPSRPTWASLAGRPLDPRPRGLALPVFRRSALGELLRFVGSPALAEVRQLELVFDDPALLPGLLAALRPGQLRGLLLRYRWPYGTPPDDLWGSPALAGLERLDLSSGYFNHDRCRPLASAPFLARLRWLSLRRNAPFDDAALGTLCRAGPPLVGLSLCGTGITNAGLEVLAGCAAMRALAALDLTGTGTSAAGVQRLTDSPHLGRLRRLHLPPHVLSEGLEARLRERFGERLYLAP